MLKLYHGANSVCSIKVRLVLEEKAMAWESHHIDLPSGQQFDPDFLALNPRAFVPVLIHGDLILRESSVIAEYIDALDPATALMPADLGKQALTRIWGTQCLEYHDSVNTLTFGSYQRQMLLAKSPEEREARFAAMPDQMRAKKVQDLVENGAASPHMTVAIERMARLCAEIDASLDGQDWLMGDSYSLAEALVTAYIFRTECVGLAGLWESRYPRMSDWYQRVKARASFEAAIAPWLDKPAMDKMLNAGKETFLNDKNFASYL